MRRSFGPDLTTPFKRTYTTEEAFTEHFVRSLRNYYKINIHFYQRDWTEETIFTEFYPSENRVVIREYNFQLLSDDVKDTSSLKSPVWMIERVEEYYKRHFVTYSTQLDFQYNPSQ